MVTNWSQVVNVEASGPRSANLMWGVSFPVTPGYRENNVMSKVPAVTV
jgi:hypothetical protein